MEQSEFSLTDGLKGGPYFDCVLRALNVFDKYLGKIVQSPQANEKGCFQYVAYNEKKFLLQMHRVSVVLDILDRRRQARFLDVGCGIGTKVFMVSTLFAQADGLEFDKNYIEVAKKVHQSSSWEHSQNISFMEGDALDFSRYSEYDVIYLYRPFHDSVNQDKLEEKIAQNIKTNAIIVGTLCNFFKLPEHIRPRMIFNNGYLKTDSEFLANKIRNNLESLGLNDHKQDLNVPEGLPLAKAPMVEGKRT